jgi:hypothetical protein
MEKLLDLTIKINKDKYKNATGGDPCKDREIETKVEIKNQHGGNVTELNESGFLSGTFSVSDIKKIKIFFELDIPISWAWENKSGADTEIEFTLKNLKYDQTKGLRLGNLGPVTAGAAKDTIFLGQNSFEVDNFTNDNRETFFHIQQAIELKNMSDDVKKIFDDFHNLIWQIQKAAEDEQITNFVSKIQKYQKAKAGTIKGKAWQAVNGYNHQAEAAINHLQKTEQSREEILNSIQKAKNESELQCFYDKAKDSELYKEGGKSKGIIDNLNKRKRVCFQIEKEDISSKIKTFLQEVLTKIIPDTIKEDSEEQELTELENMLKTFQTAGEGEEKGKIYQKYNKVINEVLTEINQEKQRYQLTKQESPETNENDGNKKSKSEPSGLPAWVWIIIIVGIITVTGIIAYFIWNQRKNSKRV